MAYTLYSLIIAQHPPSTQDYRLGDLGIDWIDYHSEKEIPQDDVPKPRDPPTRDVKRPSDDVPPRRFTQGTTALGPGIVHLFRHAAPLLPDEGFKAEGEDGTLVAVLAVPRWMGFAEFAQWLGAWSTRLEGFRMIRDASPNKTLALLKFHERTAANDFISIHTGTTFSHPQSETCHPIRIHHLLLHDLRLPASPHTLPRLLGVPPENTYELPTCPVCLERMDAVVTGLVTTPCTHSGGCRCLSRWTSGAETMCPVCRISNEAGETKCMRCPASMKHDTASPMPAAPPEADATDGHSNWICTVCAYLGCSRYEAGHARDHYTDTGHAYSMEISTGRVWDYIEDYYVHRLIQNPSDGKLVELPSATLSSRLSSISLTPAGRGPTASDEKWVAALERMTGEAQRLAGRLAEREVGFEREMERLRVAREEEGREVGRLRREVEDGERRIRELEEAVEGLTTVKITAEKKTQIASTLASALQKDLSSEKALSSGLLYKIQTLEGTLRDTAEREKAAQERVKEMEETVGDLMASISMGERVKENGGEGGDLGVLQRKKKGRR